MQTDAISKFFIKKKKKKEKKHNSHELNFLAFHRNRHIRPNATADDSIDFPGLSPYKE